MSASRRRSGDQSRYRQVDGTIPSFPSPVEDRSAREGRDREKGGHPSDHQEGLCRPTGADQLQDIVAVKVDLILPDN